MAANVHVGDIGTAFEATIVDQTGAIVNVSGASTKEPWFQRADGSTLAKAAVFTTDGTDGKIRYLSVAGDLTSPGPWAVQGHVIISGGEWHSDLYSFTLYPNLR
jgi:hypothetical protein